MTSETGIPDPYEHVLADLRAKRDQIDQTIQMLESLRGGLPAAAAPGGAPRSQASAPVQIEGAGAYLGLSIVDATKLLLANRRRQLGNAEIVAALKAGGLVMNSVDPINTVGSVLTRRFNQIGDIVRVGRGIWGLAEWYPNRSFKRKSGSKGEPGEATPNATSAPEQPLEPKPTVAPE